MAYPLFVLIPGDTFRDMQRFIHVKFLSLDVTHSTGYFGLAGQYVEAILIRDFMIDYVRGRYQEVPGAGNVREVVP